jgi:tRNA(fMet)-specific endonuclease VapC
MILLDTNVLVEILEKRSRKGEDLYSDIIDTAEPICTTSINLHEVLHGLRKYGKSAKPLLQLPVVDYSKDDALTSSEIEYEMGKIGSSVRRMDSMIAAVAINKSISLLSLDPKRFAPIAKKFPLKLFRATHT